jgi:dephospho-CoA kinase
MFSVGLTGGIASGKSTVSNLFSEHGVPVIDTDVISRQLLQPGEPAYRQVCERFGDEILGADGKIDRAALRRIVFSDPKQKKWLETMLHPLIYQRSHDAIVRHSAAAYVLLVVPLLFETNFQSLVDRILVVDCPAEQQIIRLMKRDNIDEELARSMLAQQLSNEQRVARAHDIIDNRSDNADLRAQVDALHRAYQSMAANR